MVLSLCIQSIFVFNNLDEDNDFFCCHRNLLLGRWIISIIAEANKRAKNLSFFHIDIKSLPKYYDELEINLNSLHFKFPFIALFETCLDECKKGFYELLNYTSINEFRRNKKGGMCLYILLTIWNLNVDMTWNTLTVRWSICALKWRGNV